MVAGCRWNGTRLASPPYSIICARAAGAAASAAASPAPNVRRSGAQAAMANGQHTPVRREALAATFRRGSKDARPRRLACERWNHDEAAEVGDHVGEDQRRDVAPPEVEAGEDAAGDQRGQRDARAPERQVSEAEGGERQRAGEPWPADQRLQALDRIGAVEPFFARRDDHYVEYQEPLRQQPEGALAAGERAEVARQQEPVGGRAEDENEEGGERDRDRQRQPAEAAEAEGSELHAFAEACDRPDRQGEAREGRQ